MACKSERTAIGLMSGTSLDGLDIALCRFNGNGMNTGFELLEFTTALYTDEYKTELLSVFAKKQASIEKLCLLNACTGNLHAHLVLDALKNWRVAPASVDFIASHGQTIYHAPKRLHGQADYPNATLQIGDGDHIAVKTGIITLSDFRQKHIAAGGEGAPLALYGDVILGSKPGERRILLNIGGIANLTWLPGMAQTGGIVCTDTGPGNTLIDAACRTYFNQPFDKDARLALSGSINKALLQALLAHPFFKQAVPKTTGPETFNMDFVRAAQQQSGTGNLPPHDIVATLSALTVESIAQFVCNNFNAAEHVFVSGGGAKNPFIINGLKKALPHATVNDTGSIGINPDAKEAILFALLGNEAVAGEPLIIGGNPAVLMGKMSFPL